MNGTGDSTVGASARAVLDDLTVAIVAYESADTLSGCLTSVPAGVATVVVDNASSDGSASLAESSGARVVRNAANRGYAAAANQAAAAAGGAYVLFLNPDATLLAGSLERLCQAMHDDPALAAVGPAEIREGQHAARAVWPFPRPGATWAAQLGLARRPPPEDSDGFVVGTCLLVRRTFFDRVGGFDEAFWLYGEDADFCRRIRDAGGGVDVVAGAAIAHVGGHSAARLPASFEHFHRGAELFIAKHHGRLGLLSHRLAVLVGAVVRAVVLWPAQRERAAWFARLARRQVRVLRHPTVPAACPEAATAA